MICSPRELGLGDDHSGILVLAPAAGAPGDDARAVLGLDEEIVELSVTPDRGYAFSMRGLAREMATSYGVPFRDPAAGVPVPDDPGDGQPVAIADPAGADRIVLRTVAGLDPTAPSPAWLRRRLTGAGMRPISLPVDVTNYVMLELGQPLHAFDRSRLAGTVVVRRARAGERLVTLDGVDRALDPDDLLITDDSGPIALAGTMGGAATEIDAGSTEIVIEAAHFDPAVCGRQARRHKLPSEAVRRFERGVDPQLPPIASARAAQLLAELGGARVTGVSEVDLRPATAPVRLPADLPARLTGAGYDAATVVARLTDVGCAVEPASGGATLIVSPPSWRPDLADPADLVEEVARLEGYDTIPSSLPVAPAGRGYTAAQRNRRRVGRALAGAGYVETPCAPFLGAAALEALGVPAADERRRLVRLVNPLSEDEPYLRTTLLPGLLGALRRNVGRGMTDLALVETGLVFRARPTPARAPRLPVDRRPDADEVAALEAALPEQPRHLAVALTGAWEPAGWWGPGRPAEWPDAVEAVRVAARAVGAAVEVAAAATPPWHPGRCAAVLLPGEAGGRLLGHAGELHPRACAALGLPPRTVAAEIDLDALLRAAVDVPAAPAVSGYPVATVDVAVVVDAAVPAAAVEAALRDGAGDLLEALRLFDVFTGEQIGAGRKSLAYALRLRAPDRTLTADEIAGARASAVAAAQRSVGAVLRGS
jgi:phenylalanyl-tRNA synthetase beta chain